VQVNGQLGSDRVVSNEVLIHGDLSIEVRSQMSALLFDHVLFVQMRNDAWFEPISPKHLKGVKNGYQCTLANEASYIPSYSKNDMAPQFRFIMAKPNQLAAVGTVEPNEAEHVADLTLQNSAVKLKPHQQAMNLQVSTTTRDTIMDLDVSETESVKMEKVSSTTIKGSKCQWIDGTRVCEDGQP